MKRFLSVILCITMFVTGTVTAGAAEPVSSESVLADDIEKFIDLLNDAASNEQEISLFESDLQFEIEEVEEETDEKGTSPEETDQTEEAVLIDEKGPAEKENASPETAVVRSNAVSGDWTYTSYENGTCTLDAYNGSDTNVTIPSTVDEYTVTSIDSYLFQNNEQIESVVIPGTIEEIQEAFINCKNLSSVTFSDGTSKIGMYSFENCANLKTVILPQTLKTIEHYAFHDCDALGSITIPNGTETIDYGAFYSCDVLTTVDLPDSIWTLGDGAFGYCPRLASIHYPLNWTEGGAAFEGCTGLKTITFPAGLTSIRSNAFQDADGLEDITLPDTVETIGQYAFASCDNLKTVTLPDAVETIESDTFSDCDKLVTVTLSKNLKKIGSYAFYDCDALGSITIPNGTETIDYEAFYSCDVLTTVDLPDSIWTLGDEAFGYCPRLASIHYPLNWTEGGAAFEGCTGLKTITFPAGLTSIRSNAFQDADGLEDITLPDTVETIGEYAFAYCDNLKTVTLPDAVETIESYTFYDCDKLVTVTLSKNLKTIGSEAFYDCDALRSITIPNGTETIDYRAFYSCDVLTTVDLPDSIWTLEGEAFGYCPRLASIYYPLNWTEGGAAFEGCTGLKTITFPAGLTSIRSYAFQNADGLEDITLPDTVETIGQYAFSYCDNLKTVTLPDAVETIESYTFSDCDKLVTVTLSKNLKTIGSYAFNDCDALRSITIPNGTETIDYGAFYSCDVLTTVDLPDSIRTLEGEAFGYCPRLASIHYPLNWTEGGAAFKGCTGLKTITFPAGLTSIRSYAFQDADGLEDITLQDTVETIGEYAFAYCDKLTSVSLSRKLTAIPQYLFTDCKSLKSVTGYYRIASIGYDAFNGCEQVTIYAPALSHLAAYAVANNFELVEIQEERPEDYVTALDMDVTSMLVNLNGITASGCIEVNLKFAFKEAGIGAPTLILKNTDNVSLMEETLYLDGVLIQDYEYENNQLTIPLSAESGVLKCYYRLNSRAQLRVSSSMKYVYAGQEHEDIIGVASENLEVISIEPSSNILTTSSLMLSGIAPKQSNVKIFIDGTLAKTVTANLGGSYSAQITLTNVSDGKEYTVMAVTQSSDGSELKAETTVVYQESLPEITGFVLYHGHSEGIDLLRTAEKPTISLNPSSPMTFVITVSKPEKVKKLYVTSTRSNVKRRIEAVWDQSAGHYVATGYFDENNHSYLPGNLSVEFIRKITIPETEPASKIPSYTTDRVKVTDVTLTNDSMSGVLQLYEENKETIFDTMDYAFTAGEAIKTINGTEFKLLDSVSTAGGILKITDTTMDYFVPGKNNKKYIFSMDRSDPKNLTMVLYDVVDNGAQAYTITMGLDTASTLKGSIFVEGGKALLKVADYGIDEYRLLQEIDKSTTIQDKARAKMEVAGLSFAHSFMRAGPVAASILVTSAALTIGGPVAWGMALIFGIGAHICASMADKAWEIAQADILGGKYDARWAMDPSGIVYEAVLSNPLQGATVKAFWVPYDEENPDFWKNPPKDEDGILWDAEQWNQENPLITDEAGWYAWDVPEGWWQVRASMDGYQEDRSEWLSVAPPQLGINLGLVSDKAPELSEITLHTDHMTLGFDKYLTAESISKLKLKTKEGTDIAFKADISSEESPEGVKLAREITLHFDQFTLAKGDQITVSWENQTLVSYAGTYANAGSETVIFTGEKVFKAPEELTLYRGGSMTMAVTLENAQEGDEVSITAENSAFVTVKADQKPDEKGQLQVTLTPEILGQTNLILTLKGTELKLSVPVTIQPALSAASSTAEVSICGKAKSSDHTCLYGAVKTAAAKNIYLITASYDGKRMTRSAWLNTETKAGTDQEWSMQVSGQGCQVMLWLAGTYEPMLDSALLVP